MESYVRPAVHTPPLFIPPQMLLLMSFGNNMMYPDLPSLPLYYFQGPPTPPESLRGMAPVVGPPIPPPMYFVVDPMLYARIVSQIDYYFRATITWLKIHTCGRTWMNSLNRWVPIKINVFGWRTNLNRIATMDELLKRIVLVGLNVCSLCLNATDSVDHIFTACYILAIVWNHICDNWHKTGNFHTILLISYCLQLCA
ncbi:putative reverse transcriptase zinc-binding domain-containing protein [Helianthus annuus]|nr:putative reverse transcriptase zinc-binding domain-containing protein [Helianthus annuus]